MPALLFLIYTLLSGTQQGIIAWLFREYVPTKRLDWINAALHVGGGLLYALFVSEVMRRHGGLVWAAWPVAGLALLLRWAVFDPVLNLTFAYINYREGRSSFYGIAFRPFEVGTSAFSDKATIWAAGLLRLQPSVARFIEWLIAVGLILYLVLTYHVFQGG